MMYQLGLDFGSTLTKMALIQPGGKDSPFPRAVFKYKTNNNPEDFYKALEAFLKAENIPVRSIQSVSATGTYSHLVKESLFGVPVHRVPEVTSIAKGGLALAGLKSALVVNMGTGTTYVDAAENEIRHLGGTGVGGGTLTGLGQSLLGTSSVRDIVRLASHGRLNRVDLLIGDITEQELEFLPPNLTAANFGKLAHPLYADRAKDATKEDLAMALINLVLQVIGSMAVMVCKSSNKTNVVFVGTLTRIPQIENIYALFSKVYGLQFIVPPFAMYGTALGSIFALSEEV
ncbi:MAG: hypothetical protein WBK97_04125 [Bacteroidales bacterium]|jgi:type II pantothenate kinase